MNVRKSVDYSAMYQELTAILSQNLPQMDEIYAIAQAFPRATCAGCAIFIRSMKMTNRSSGWR